MRLAVVGKGGAGKSVVAGTLARLLARRGQRVLALDSDLMPGLATSLGAASSAGSLMDAAARSEDGRWRLKKGIGPAIAVKRFATEAPDGVLLLEAGKAAADGLDPIRGSLNAFYQVVHRLHGAKAFADWAFVGDLPAGPRQVAYGWAPYAETILVVVEPTWKSVLTARRTARIARSLVPGGVSLVANKVAGSEDQRRIVELVGEEPLAVIPSDGEVTACDRLGVAPIEHAPSSPAIQAIERLVDALPGGSLPKVKRG